MKKIIKSAVCALLVFLAFAFSFIPSGAYTDDDIVSSAQIFIYEKEGGYDAVAPKDNGAASIGKIGWHASRALLLLRDIARKNEPNAKKILGEDLFNEIMTASEKSWNDRAFTSSEAAKVKALLGTKEGRETQDATSYKDIKGYVSHGKSLGIKDPRALVYFADVENQIGSNGAERVANAAKSAANGGDVALDTLYSASLKDKTASKSPDRRKAAYNYAKNLAFGSSDASPSAKVYKTGKYRINTESDPLRMRSGPGSSYSLLGASIPKGMVVSVAEVSGSWGKVAYDGKTGWISLSYAEEAAFGGSVDCDVNGNGKIDAQDARMILRYSASIGNLTNAQKEKADANNDGKISAQDARTALRVSAKLD